MTTPSTVQPALTPEEWREATDGKARTFGDSAMFVFKDGVSINFGRHYDDVIDNQQRHPLAALCLYQQPFGFTHEDVINLRREALEIRRRMERFEEQRGDPELQELFESLADRISALLPPPEKP